MLHIYTPLTCAHYGHNTVCTQHLLKYSTVRVHAYHVADCQLTLYSELSISDIKSFEQIEFPFTTS